MSENGQLQNTEIEPKSNKNDECSII